MKGNCIKILVIIGLLYSYIKIYKLGKLYGQREYFNFLNNGKKIYKYKNLKWHYIKPTKYNARRYKKERWNK